MGHSKFSVDSPTLEAASTSGVPEPQSIPMLAVVEEELDHAPADPQIEAPAPQEAEREEQVAPETAEDSSIDCVLQHAVNIFDFRDNLRYHFDRVNYLDCEVPEDSDDSDEEMN